MNDWPTPNQTNISDYVNGLKEFFGNPLTVNSISQKKIDFNNSWQLESGSIIINLIEISSLHYGIDNFDSILENILKYYSK